MATSTEIQSILKQKFQSLHTKEDLLCLLNFAKPFVYGKKAKLFTINQLTWHYSSKNNNSKYYSFSIKKKSGNLRTIHAPIPGLKAIQKTIAYILEAVHEPHESACGFRKGSSIKENAAKHVGSRYVYNLDLKDFFPSIDQARVWKCLQLPPFSIKSKIIKDILSQENPQITILNKFDGDILDSSQALRIRCMYNGLILLNGTWETQDMEGNPFTYLITVNNKKREAGFIQINLMNSSNVTEVGSIKIGKDEIHEYFKIIIKHQKELIDKIPIHTPANIIARICCAEMDVERPNENGEWITIKKNVLPQGAPTSPVITNIVCKKLDIQLTGLAKRFGLKYSRYADDITFSSEHNVYKQNNEFNIELKRIINNQRLHIKDTKTRLQKEGFRQEVTGLLVNKKINVQKRYIKQLRTWIHLLEKKNYNEAINIIKSQHLNDRGNVKKQNIRVENVIDGKLAYLKMIKGENNHQYITLINRFNIILNQNIRNESSETISIDHLNSNKENIVFEYTSTADIVDDIFKKGLDKAMEDFDLLF